MHTRTFEVEEEENIHHANQLQINHIILLKMSDSIESKQRVSKQTSETAV